MIRTQNFQPVKYCSDRFSAGGITPADMVLKRGNIVTHSPTAENALVIAPDGKAGFFLTRDVMLATGLQAYVDADELRPNKAGFQTPFLAGGSAQMEDYDEIWVEGTDHLDVTVGNAIVAGQKLTTKGGKFSTLTNSETQELIGIVRTVIPSANGAGGTKRFLIEIVRSGVNIPAA